MLLSPRAPPDDDLAFFQWDRHGVPKIFIRCRNSSLRCTLLQTFQKPLTPEEEQLYLKRYRDGDLAARNMLVERNLRLVAHNARKYQTSEEDM